MELKIFFDEIEIGLPQDRTPKKILENLDVMAQTFAHVVENSNLLEELKITEYHG